MKKRIAGILLGVMTFAALLAGCGKNEATKAAKESVETEKEGNGDDAETEAAEKEEADQTAEDGAENDIVLEKIGVLLPSDSEDEAGLRDRTQFGELFLEAGYEADIHFAEGSKEQQIRQLRELLADESVIAIVVSPVDAYALTDVLEEADEIKKPVFDYDDLIMNTDDLKYFVTFDTRAVGQQIGQNIVKKENLDKLKESGESKTIEFFMGDSNERAELFLYNGILEILQPYLEEGTLVCRSGKLDYADVAVDGQDAEAAGKAFEKIIKEHYRQEKTPDIICTANDLFALKAAEILENNKVSLDEENWPMITGVGAQAEAVKRIAEGSIALTVYLDRKELAQNCVDLIRTYFSDEDPEVKNYNQYDNGVKIIGTVTCDGRVIDADNYQILVDKGVYREEEIAPDLTRAPLPEDTRQAEPTEAPNEKDADEPAPTVTEAPLETPAPTEEPEVTGMPELKGDTKA